MKRLSYVLIISLLSLTARSQQSDSADASIVKLPEKYFQTVEKKSSQLEQKITSKSKKALQQFSRQEQKLYKKLFKIDSLAAKEIFGTAKDKINFLSDKLN
ncbi:MAG: hypothetical protein HYX40_09075 [Sphingobacteriales bacterium]|nr:hypothetical protein [Sphingobacteriales bacterium]